MSIPWTPGTPLGLGMSSGDTWAWYLRCAVDTPRVERIFGPLGQDCIYVFFFFASQGAYYLAVRVPSSAFTVPP